MQFSGFAATKAGGKLEPFKYDPTPLGPDDVEIEITHCGICHSDIHLVNNDWGISEYPLLPGHEIVGTVVETGSAVSGLEPGTRVAVGWQCGACLVCDQCVSGEDNLCAESQATCVGHYGGFADRVRVDSRFAFVLPDGLESETAAPLMCAGITVYSPFKHFGVRPSSRVGVIGIGGLGHLALQFANAFGCEVTAFSTSKAKAEEAIILGAHHFVDTSDEAALDKAAGSIDFLLSTVNADLDWNAYMGVLRPNGMLCVVGVTPNPIAVHPMALIMGRKAISGSPIGSRATIREMLDFAARHGIQAQTETIPMSQVNEAMERIKANKARYRMVLAN
ncbi:MAG: NAD(P)-dependent alcohol dehydrogenase [bacterium]|nr:NAD(P)-dependent alcohol dehydrogenase [bacterium]